MYNTVVKMVPMGNSKEFNLGLIDFGVSICLARNPECTVCLMADFCSYFNGKCAALS
jgi:endonuclease III